MRVFWRPEAPIRTKADIAQKQQADQAELRKRGVASLVTAVDAKAGAITNQYPNTGRGHQAARYRGRGSRPWSARPRDIKFWLMNTLRRLGWM